MFLFFLVFVLPYVQAAHFYIFDIWYYGPVWSALILW